MIRREIIACLEVVHRQCCVSRATAALVLACTFAAGVSVSAWFIAIFIQKIP